MTAFLGFDTSNYTTSAALFFPETGEIRQEKKLLPVPQGQKGLRQSDCVFHHTVQLPQVTEALLASPAAPAAVCASAVPRMQAGSYMPCFLVGVAAAKIAAGTNGVPYYETSHQHGHIAAAAFGAGKPELLNGRFLAFHVSGGTTEAVLVEPDEAEIFRCTLVAESLDLKAGQAIDRAGVMLGLPFPCGAALEQLAAESDRVFRIRPTLREGCPSLSGIENKCKAMLDRDEPAKDVAAFCLQSVAAALEAMTDHLLGQYGELPLLYAGGVMSNAMIRDHFTARFGAHFAPPALSADNAAGVAILGYLKHERR